MTDKDQETFLRECPCCGSAAQFNKVYRDNPNQGGEYVECTNKSCGLSSVLMFAMKTDVKPLLAEKWNKRAGLAAANRNATLREVARFFEQMPTDDDPTIGKGAAAQAVLGLINEKPAPVGMVLVEEDVLAALKKDSEYLGTSEMMRAEANEKLAARGDAEPAMSKYIEHGVAEEVTDPIERLRAFLSFALRGQDWIDVERFIDALPRGDAEPVANHPFKTRIVYGNVPAPAVPAGYTDTQRLDWFDANPQVVIVRSGKQHIRPLIDAAIAAAPKKEG